MIKYEIIGDDTAPTYFRINETDGNITVQRDIRGDQTIDYQVNIYTVIEIVKFNCGNYGTMVFWLMSNLGRHFHKW